MIQFRWLRTAYRLCGGSICQPGFGGHEYVTLQFRAGDGEWQNVDMVEL